MVWGMIAMAALSAIGSMASASSASKQNANQAAWARYNAQMGYNNDMANIDSQTMFSMFNASMAMGAAKSNVRSNQALTQFNINRTRAAASYNDSLMAEDDRQLWEAEGLDLQILAKQRSDERSSIVAHQAASGTTVDEGSNSDVVTAQRSAELMDAFVIQHNADTKSASISNARAKGEWQANMAIQKLSYEGRMKNYNAMNQARMEAMGGLVSAGFQAMSGARTARYKLQSGMSGADTRQSAQSAQISSDLTSGLFSAVGKGFSAYYGSKNAQPDDSLISGSGSVNASADGWNSSNYNLAG